MRSMLDLRRSSCWHSPGYRHLTIVLVDQLTGNEHSLFLPPTALQSVIMDCADAAKQIGAGPPIDWDAYPSPIFWPTITPWRNGPRRQGG
jgi:hypothetical protein